MIIISNTTIIITWEGGGRRSLCDHLMSIRIFTLTITNMLNTSFKDYEKSGYNLKLELLIIVFHILGEVGLLSNITI